MRTTTILIAALMTLSSALFASKSLDLRLNPVLVDQQTSTLYVDIEVRYNQSGNVNLAGQNFRLYYNAQSLHLDVNGSKSKLPADKYSSLNIVDHVEGIAADEVNQVPFDDELGFVNASIDLEANKAGGIVLNRATSWVAVARLKFSIRETLDDYEVVWGRMGKTDQYATAFVEVSEWIEPFNIKTVEVAFYEDLSLPNDTEKIVSVPEIKIGPNPTTQFINITFQQPSTSDGSVVIRDVSGRLVRSKDFIKGERNVRVDLSDLAASNYFLEISSDQQVNLYQEKILIAR